MVGSRLERIGSIFTRTTGLMRSGAMKPVDKPLWYEVYKAFPPKYEPRFDRRYEEKPHRQIFYPEDEIRVIFYKNFPSVGVIELDEEINRPTLCQHFVEEYQRLQNEGNTPADDLVKAVALALEAKGIYLNRSSRPFKMESENQSTGQKPFEGFRLLSDLFEEGLEKLETERSEKKEGLEKLETERAGKKEGLDELETEEAGKKDN